MSVKGLLHVVVAATAALLIAGCGSSSPKASPAGGDSTPSGSTSPTATLTSSPSASATTPADKAVLETMVLMRADLPASWKASPYKADPDDAANAAEFSRCLGERNTDSDQVAEADSDYYDRGPAEISSSASSFTSQSDLDVDIATLHSPKMSSCFQKEISTVLLGSLPTGSKVDSASFKVVPGSAGFAANVAGTASGTVLLTVQGQRATIYLTSVFITGPLIESEIDFTNLGAPLPSSLTTPLIEKIATRTAAG
ncbi:MAG TPA: hypothetical protein VFE15_01580 [Marmoricola sp.]|jgi:hypothetical protein|nr:hypothetical protein [Marmoricola sp.]